MSVVEDEKEGAEREEDKVTRKAKNESMMSEVSDYLFYDVLNSNCQKLVVFL